MSVASKREVSGGDPYADEGKYEPVSIQNIVRSHHGELIRFLRRRLPVPEDADDAAQEAYLRMLKYQGSQAIASPASLLFRIAGNIAIDLMRAGRAHRAADHLQIDDVHLVSDTVSTERIAVAWQTLECLHAAVEDLPPKCRRVFLLSRTEGMTYAEIARRCEISVKMVEKHISRALAVCMRKLDRAEDSPGVAGELPLDRFPSDRWV